MTSQDWSQYREWYLTEGSARGYPLSETTLLEDHRILQRLARRGLRLKSLTVRGAKLFLVDEYKRGLAPGSVNNISKALRRWLRHRDGRDVLLPTWREPDPVDKALSRDQKLAALAYVNPDALLQLRAQFVAAFALTSGVEPAEAGPMNATDFDFERGGVHVRHPSKGHRSGFVPLPWGVMRAARVWLDLRPVSDDDPEAVFTTWYARCAPRRARPAGLSAILQDVQLVTGVPINWQAARHTCATDLGDAGYGDRYIMKHLRLSSMAHVPRYREARASLEKYRALVGIDPFVSVERDA